MSRDQFIQYAPNNSIALDGYCSGPPWFDHNGPRASFDHHKGVDRMATRATCAQVLMAIRQGLFSTFLNDYTHKVHVFVSDCDEDVCTAVYLLKHGRQAENVLNERINYLVSAEDVLDCTAGAYPFPKTLKELKKLAWIFQPYKQFRISGNIDDKDSYEYENVIEQVGDRILQYVHGNSKEIEVDYRYELLHKEGKFALIKEIGSHSKTGLLSDGYQSYISARSRQEPFKWTYTIGKLAFASFNLEGAIEALNRFEDQTIIQSGDTWGGGNMIGGSPRVNGSSLSPEKVFSIIKEFI